LLFTKKFTKINYFNEVNPQLLNDKFYNRQVIKDVFHLVIQVDTSIVLCYLLNAKKDRTFVSTCVIKWKTP